MVKPCANPLSNALNDPTADVSELLGSLVNPTLPNVTDGLNLLGALLNRFCATLAANRFANKPTPPRITVFLSPNGVYTKPKRGSGITDSRSEEHTSELQSPYAISYAV